MATETQRNQNLLSEHLLLLQQFGYRNLSYYRGEMGGLLPRKYEHEANRDLHLLDTITAALATGSSGDVYAAAFDKHQGLRLILAKNGSPTQEDRAAANELISLIQNPKTNDWSDLFPFLINRCRENINHRITKLAASITKQLRDTFSSALRYYKPSGDVRSEFPTGVQFRYRDEIPAFPVIWDDYIQDITRRCQALDLNSNLSNISTLRKQLHDLCLVAKTVLTSRFLKWFVDEECSPLWYDMEIERFKRRIAKCCQYVDSVNRLIRKAKKLPPISHDWVTMDFAGSGQGPFSIPSPSVHGAVEGVVGKPLDDPTKENAMKIFGPQSQAWDKGAKGTAHVHAELRIILHFSQSSSPDSPVHAIGVSKRSCLACALWIESLNDLFETHWMTSGSHGKPHPNWALPGDACSYQSGDQVDQEVMKQVYEQLLYEVKSLTPVQGMVLKPCMPIVWDNSEDEEYERERQNKRERPLEAYGTRKLKECEANTPIKADSP